MTEEERFALGESLARILGKGDSWVLMVVRDSSGELLSNLPDKQELIALLDAMANAVERFDWRFRGPLPANH